MYFSTSVVAVALTSLLSVVSAQTYYPVNPEDIDLGTKTIWCGNQVSSCSLLCLDQESGGGFTNDCDPDTLQFQCICADNTVPNATQYSQTIPYFLCTYQVQNCVDNCGQYDANCPQLCVSGKTCGATNPKRVTSSLTTDAATKTATSKSPTGTAGDDDTAFDAQPTSDNSETTSATQDDAPAETGTGGQTRTPNAGHRVSSVPVGAYAASVMLLSVLCGAFVFQL